MNSLEVFAYFTAIAIFLLTLDDLFIDLISIVYRLKPKLLSDFDIEQMQALKEKKMAIMIANWKESDVLQRMITGNLRRVDYKNFDFFLGVYPNDTETWQAATQLSKMNSNVFVVVNTAQGPTTKGQMLNEIFQQILKSEVASGIEYDLFILHDSEDILHPLSLSLINSEAENFDFIQIPVLSLPVQNSKFVAGTYIDEFSESHGKELCVRSFLKAGIPSAGVGTAISRKLALHIVSKQNELLRSDTLTEDYFLGISSHLQGFRTTFVNAYRKLFDGKKDFISTREYFPQKASASVRQKTRWTMGICFQGFNLLGWQGNLVTRYFLWRDRRSLINSVLISASLALILIAAFDELLFDNSPKFIFVDLFVFFTLINTGAMFIRVVQRMRYVWFFYGARTALMVPFRWLVANYVNTIASARAFLIYWKSRATKVQPRWVKTDHVLPADFGQEIEAREVST